MSLYGLNPRQVLLNVGATAVTYAAASRYSQNHPALLSQAAVSLTMALARPFLEKQAPDDKKYFLGSFALIGAVGALCGLSWKVNALASMCLAVGSYTFRLSSVQTGQEPDRAKSNVPPLFKLIIQGFKGVLEFKEQKKEETLKAIQEALSICDKEALFYTTPNDNSLLHIAVVTGQFNVAMALLQRAQELGVLREFLSKQNQTGYKADQIMKALFKEDNLGKEYSSFCDSVLSSKETFCEGTSVLVAQITVPFQNEASKWLGEVSTETVKKLSLEGLFKLLPPSEDPSSSSSSKEAVNFDLLAEDMSGALNNTGMTDRLANSWAFGERDTAEVLPFLDKAIAHFENKPQLLTRMLCRPNNADVAIPDELAIGGTPRNTPLMLLVKMGNEHAPEAVEKVLPYYDQEALFSTTGNSNSPLHIAVVTGQFDVAMALMKRAAELEVLDEFLAMQNRAGYTADEIMQALVGHPNPNGSYLKLCDSVLGGEEINKARAKGDIAKICHIRNPFFFSARDCSGDRKISSKTIKDYSLKQFFSHLNPEVRDGGNASKLEGKRAAGSSASGSSLAAPEDKEAIKQRIIKTPRYEPSFQDLSVELPSLEYFSLFAHVHEILPGLYLGDYRAFLSVDPEFVQRYKMIDQIEEIGDGRNRQRIMKAVMPNLDKLGCSKLGIGLVVSVTQFQPDPAVPEDDWSLFRPNLDGIKRIQIPVDDTESTWELLEPQLDGIFEVIDQARVEEKPVLVHCVKGACRSAAVMIAYLMNRYEVSYEQAHNYVISTRNQVDIKPSWQGSRESGTGLLGYEAKLRR